MADGLKEWRTPGVAEQKRRGALVDLDIVDEWIAGANTDEQKGLFDELARIGEYDTVEGAKLIDEIISKGLRTQEEIVNVILPKEAAAYGAFTSTITGENLIRLFDMAPKDELTAIITDAPYFGGNLISFKLIEIGKKVPAQFIRWALRYSDRVEDADKSPDKSVYTEVVKDWIARADADTARAVFMLTGTQNPKLSEELQILLANKLTPSAAAEILCMYDAVQQLTDPIIGILWNNVPKDQKRMVQANSSISDELK